ncbi:DUF1801 domain-containing protein [Agromyces sp. MMS24-K17]|uniref:DUF1801 domain-containing protein n=1 Tax=Agromyces sp. MMS24-K17 TaxID=3372850 RepID=UPI0037542F12
MAEPQTKPTAESVGAFLDAVEHPGRREDGLALRELFDRVTGTDAVMWGPSIVGYGLEHYRYASGREGDWMVVGFSPRKASMSLYGLQRPGTEDVVAALGKVRLGAGCVYTGRLSSIDLDALEELIGAVWREASA